MLLEQTRVYQEAKAQGRYFGKIVVQLYFLGKQLSVSVREEILFKVLLYQFWILD